MFKWKKRNAAENAGRDEQKAVVGSGGSHVRMRLGRVLTKKTVLVLAALFVVGTVTAIGVLYLKDNGNDGNRSADGSQTDSGSQWTPFQEATIEAQDSYNPETGEGYEEAISKLNASLDKAENDEETAWAYIEQASVYMNAKQYQKAREAGRKAESIYPSNVSAEFIGLASHKLGDNAEAAKYYQLAIDRMKQISGYNPADVKYYEGLLNQVKAN